MNRRADEGVRHAQLLLFGSVEPVQPSPPAKYSLVSSYQTVAFERGSDDEAVGGVSMKTVKTDGADADLAIHRNFVHALFQQFPSPKTRVHGKPDSTSCLKHRDFPEGDRRDTNLTGLPSLVDRSTGSVPQPLLAGS